MKTKGNSIAGWDFSLWFAVLSPVIVVIIGIFRRLSARSMKLSGKIDPAFAEGTWATADGANT